MILCIRYGINGKRNGCIETPILKRANVSKDTLI